MDFLKNFINVFLHLDKSLGSVIELYGVWTYGILFLIVFCETGLVVTPILPGDSLLFAAGAFAAIGNLEFLPLLLILIAAAVLGDGVNYFIGHKVGVSVFREGNRWLKKDYLDRTERFFAKHGTKAIVFARFVPIVRTIAPFVAGMGSMRYRTFFVYNVVGGAAWVTLFLGGGYVFGNIPSVREHFLLVILAIIVVSCLPAVYEAWKARRKS